jgi:hypothetical protein
MRRVLRTRRSHEPLTRHALAILGFGLLCPSTAFPGEVVDVTPVSWRGQDRPAFAVRCRKDAADPRAMSEYVSRSAVRLDGEVLEGADIHWGMVDALARPPNLTVRPGQTHTFLMLLGGHLPHSAWIGSVFADYTILDWQLTLSPGDHRAAFRSWSEWTDDATFVWVPPLL